MRVYDNCHNLPIVTRVHAPRQIMRVFYALENWGLINYAPNLDKVTGSAGICLLCERDY